MSPEGRCHAVWYKTLHTIYDDDFLFLTSDSFSILIISFPQSGGKLNFAVWTTQPVSF